MVNCSICYPMVLVDCEAVNQVTMPSGDTYYLCPSCAEAFELGQNASQRIRLEDITQPPLPEEKPATLVIGSMLRQAAEDIPEFNEKDEWHFGHPSHYGDR